MDDPPLPKFPGDPDDTPDRRREVPDRDSVAEVGFVLLVAVAAVVLGSVLSLRVLLRCVSFAPLG